MQYAQVTMTKQEMITYIERMLECKDIPEEKLDLIFNILLLVR